MKPNKRSILAYVLGVVILALGTAFMEKADFGMSMVVAPAYLIHLKLSQIWPFFSFGVAEYTLQAVLLLAMMLVLRQVRLRYLFSFVTAFFYGNVLDLWLLLFGGLTADGLPVRVICYLCGLVLCSLGVAYLFETTIAPEVYELFVKELAVKHGFSLTRCKTVYDCVSCAAGVILSFAFFGFGHFEGVKLGTVFCALINGWLIGKCGKLVQFTLRSFPAQQGRVEHAA